MTEFVEHSCGVKTSHHHFLHYDTHVEIRRHFELEETREVLSSGIEDLDPLLNGGFPLSCVVLIPHNRNERVVSTVLQCFLADGVTQGHAIGWLTSFKHWETLSEALPKIASFEESKKVSNPETGLRIAWQYRRYLDNDQQRQQPTQKSTKQSQHSLDLSRKMVQEDLQSCPYHICDLYDLDNLVCKVETIMKECGSLECPFRLVIDNFGMMTDGKDTKIYQTLYRLKSLIQATPIVILISMESTLLSGALLQNLKHLSDGVLCFDSISEDAEIMKLVSEPSSVVSLMKIERLPSKGTLLANQPLHELYLVRNRRRKLRIRQVEVDPEKEMNSISTCTSNLDF